MSDPRHVCHIGVDLMPDADDEISSVDPRHAFYMGVEFAMIIDAFGRGESGPFVVSSVNLGRVLAAAQQYGYEIASRGEPNALGLVDITLRLPAGAHR